MELLRAHSRGFVNLEINHLRTFLTEECRGDWMYDSPASDKTLPLKHYLLDNESGPREGSWRGCGALHVMLEFSQPLEIIDKMVEKGGTVKLLIISEAIMTRRVDVL